MTKFPSGSRSVHQVISGHTRVHSFAFLIVAEARVGGSLSRTTRGSKASTSSPTPRLLRQALQESSLKTFLSRMKVRGGDHLGKKRVSGSQVRVYAGHVDESVLISASYKGLLYART